MDASDSDEGETLSTEQMIHSLYKGMKKMNENVRVVREDIVGIKNSIEENYVELNERLGEYMKQNADLEDRLEAANERIDVIPTNRESKRREETV